MLTGVGDLPCFTTLHLLELKIANVLAICIEALVLDTAFNGNL